MVSERNRILDLISFVESCGVTVNIGKNKARGNKGYFKVADNSFRIDIAKNLMDDSIVSILAHEFAHFVHYQYDKTLKSLDFIFNSSDIVTEELLAVTVATIPKSTVEPIFKQCDTLKSEIKILKTKLSTLNINAFDIEKKVKKSPLRYLLKYDNVNVFEGFLMKSYSITDLKDDTGINLYIRLKSKQRTLKRLNARITRLNKYYNQPTELFARAFELYVTDKKLLSNIAPTVLNIFEEVILSNKIELLANFVKKY